jgi:hypothetical protein
MKPFLIAAILVATTQAALAQQADPGRPNTPATMQLPNSPDSQLRARGLNPQPEPPTAAALLLPAVQSWRAGH